MARKKSKLWWKGRQTKGKKSKELLLLTDCFFRTLPFHQNKIAETRSQNCCSRNRYNRHLFLNSHSLAGTLLKLMSPSNLLCDFMPFCRKQSMPPIPK